MHHAINSSRLLPSFRLESKLITFRCSPEQLLHTLIEFENLVWRIKVFAFFNA